MTHWILIGLGVLIVALTVVAVFDLLPALRIDARSATPDLACTSIKVPPLKSMPKFSPWVKNSVIATIESSAEIGKLMRRNRVKSNLVSSGTIRSDGNSPKQLTRVSTAIRTPSPMRTKCVTTGPA